MNSAPEVARILKEHYIGKLKCLYRIGACKRYFLMLAHAVNFQKIWQLWPHLIFISTYIKYTERYCPYLEDGETS